MAAGSGRATSTTSSVGVGVDQRAGVQQCLAHLLRYLDDAHAIDPDAQAWGRQVADALRGAIHEVNTRRAADPGRTWTPS